MNTPEMEKLAEQLDNLPEDHFDMAKWAFGHDLIVCEEDLEVCGTTCCIAGLAIWVMSKQLLVRSSVSTTSKQKPYSLTQGWPVQKMPQLAYAGW